MSSIYLGLANWLIALDWLGALTAARLDVRKSKCVHDGTAKYGRLSAVV
mgnify:CR=1 FL=1